MKGLKFYRSYPNYLITKHLFAALCATLFLTANPANTATLEFTYSWSATNLVDSNSNPPPNAMITTSGTFTVAFDPLGSLSLEDQPIVAASSFTDNEGNTLTSSDTFSTIKVQTAGQNPTYRIVVGGIVSPLDKADESVSGNNDFMLSFLAFGGSGGNVGQPTGTALPMSYDVSNGNIASINGELSVSLQAVSDPNAPTVVPLPAGLPLLLSALGLCALLRRRC